MAKQAAPKPESKKSGRNTDRKNGKANKQNPKPNNSGATGRTIGGYSEAALARRAAKRSPVTFEGLKNNAKR